MWSGLNVSTYLIGNKELKKVRDELIKTHSVAEREVDGQTVAVIGKKGYYFIKEMKDSSIVSIPYHSWMSYNAGLILGIILILLVDFTILGGLLLSLLLLLWGYLRYNTYKKRREQIEDVIKKYAKKA